MQKLQVDALKILLADAHNREANLLIELLRLRDQVDLLSKPREDKPPEDTALSKTGESEPV